MGVFCWSEMKWLDSKLIDLIYRYLKRKHFQNKSPQLSGEKWGELYDTDIKNHLRIFQLPLRQNAIVLGKTCQTFDEYILLQMTLCERLLGMQQESLDSIKKTFILMMTCGFNVPVTAKQWKTLKIFERNEFWMKKILEKKNRVQILYVGLGHLFFDRGMVSLLAKDGFEIRQVKWRKKRGQSISGKIKINVAIG